MRSRFTVNKTKPPLYPKLSSIYNKILQLVSAILLIVILMAIWVSSTEKSQRVIEQQFEQTARQYLFQAIAGTEAILIKNTVKLGKKSSQALLQSYLNNMAEADFVRAIHLYDSKGELLLASQGVTDSSSSIKALYGIEQAHKTLNKSEQYIPFISEIRHEKLTGYLRITLQKSLLISELEKENNEQHNLFRMLLIIAGLVGFLLTRGLNRFSRQGFRIPVTNEPSS